MVYKDTNVIITVKENVAETSGYRSILFDRPQGFHFESGDWIDIQFGNQALTGGKTYSLSSSPTESDLMITFKDGFSEIKRMLAVARAGDKLIITQYGNDYKFTLKPHKPSTLIAGGVGIAPFRSMVKEMYDLKDKNEVNLIYLNKTSDFLFKNELSMWQKQLPGLTINYLITNNLKKKERTKALLDAVKTTEHSFYIAGPEGMVESTEHVLLDFGVNVADIKIDSFGGY